jgi:hypothetical protein
LSGSVSITRGGERKGRAMTSGPLVNGNSQTATPFQLLVIVL